MFALHGKITKSGFAVKLVVTFVWCGVSVKTRCLPRFRINRQIPRCVLTWVLVIIAFCYDVLCEPCDGFIDLLSVLLEFHANTWRFAFWFLVLGFPQWVGSFLAMFGSLRKTVLPL